MENPHQIQQTVLLSRIARSIEKLHSALEGVNEQLEGLQSNEQELIFVRQVLERWTRGAQDERLRRQDLEGST